MEFIVDADLAGSRLDVAIKLGLPDLSRGQIQKAIKSGCCALDGAVTLDPAAKARLGQKITFSPPQARSCLEPSAGAIDVLWQDGCLAVCDKPAGLVAHPCPSCAEETVASRLLARFPELAELGGERPGIVHRLDKDTSGLMIVALTEPARARLAEAFAGRRISKEYLALVAGVAPERGACREPIGRHQALKTRMAIVPEAKGGKPASTEWQRLWHNDKISLVRVVIHTGRTHQIRVHMAHLGFPILGDAVYAPRQVAAMAPRQMLHAWRLAFAHPRTGEALRFCQPPPEDFHAAIARASHRMLRIVVTGNQGCGKSSFCGDLAELGAPVISADAIVAQLYSRRSAATEWIGAHLGADALNADDTVNKPGLLRILESNPGMRRELELAIHGLVYAEIERFWRANADRPLAVAEVPLYFESSLDRLRASKPLVVGVSCPKAARWQRIAASRGWPLAKIEALEGWQWPEEKKMAACDVEIRNDGDSARLKRSAAEFLEEAKRRQEACERRELERIKRMCECAFA